MHNQMFKTVDAVVKPGAQPFEESDLSSPLTQETNRESERQRDIDESWPVIGDFAHNALGDRYHLIFE
jgi:hypothetical protein